jgi:epoxyqueuosine reductase
MASSAELRRELEKRAQELGLSLLGVTGVEPSEHLEFYRSWLDSGYHGEMAYLARQDAIARRADLHGTMVDARSCVVVAHEYYLEGEADRSDDRSRAVVARYARGDDYHDVLKSRLQQLLSWLDTRVEGGVTGRAYVDTGPILERDLARRAGLGWLGRNTMLIHPSRGSYFFLGVLLVDLSLPADRPFAEDRCGTCRACLDACPTGALLGRDDEGAPVIDARRCISYLTIELRGAIPVGLRPAMGNRVFGCDICQEVCPWNGQFARPSSEPAYGAREELDGPPLVELATGLLDLDEQAFRAAYRGSPVLRAGRDGLLRNVCVALGNWGSEDALPVLTRALSDRAILVRRHAAWGLGRLAAGGASKALAERLRVEESEEVIREIRGALA